MGTALVPISTPLPGEAPETLLDEVETELLPQVHDPRAKAFLRALRLEPHTIHAASRAVGVHPVMHKHWKARIPAYAQAAEVIQAEIDEYWEDWAAERARHGHVDIEKDANGKVKRTVQRQDARYGLAVLGGRLPQKYGKAVGAEVAVVVNIISHDESKVR